MINMFHGGYALFLKDLQSYCSILYFVYGFVHMAEVADADALQNIKICYFHLFLLYFGGIQGFTAFWQERGPDKVDGVSGRENLIWLSFSVGGIELFNDLFQPLLLVLEGVSGLLVSVLNQATAGSMGQSG